MALILSASFRSVLLGFWAFLVNQRAARPLDSQFHFSLEYLTMPVPERGSALCGLSFVLFLRVTQNYYMNPYQLPLFSIMG
jgi:hypothetical protein